MSTVFLRCPYCGEGLRVAVQPSSVRALSSGDEPSSALRVTFDAQTVAHECESKGKRP